VYRAARTSPGEASLLPVEKAREVEKKKGRKIEIRRG